MQKVEFLDEDGFNYMVSIPVLGEEKPLLLRMWVAYDRGRRYSQFDYSEVFRGYYLYCSFEESSEEWFVRSLSSNTNNCRVYLGEVKRQSGGWARDFSRLAESIVFKVVKDIFPDLKLDWEKLYRSYWSGKGSGVGLFCDFYKVILPKEAWLG